MILCCHKVHEMFTLRIECECMCVSRARNIDFWFECVFVWLLEAGIMVMVRWKVNCLCFHFVKLVNIAKFCWRSAHVSWAHIFMLNSLPIRKLSTISKLLLIEKWIQYFANGKMNDWLVSYLKMSHTVLQYQWKTVQLRLPFRCTQSHLWIQSVQPPNDQTFPAQWHR